MSLTLNVKQAVRNYKELASGACCVHSSIAHLRGPVKPQIKL